MADMTTRIEPVRKQILVPGTPDEVFRLFTDRMGEWWPTETHSVSGEEDARVVVESELGGRVYEVATSGEEHEWGTFTGWEDGRRVEMTWHPGLSPEESTRLMVTFEAAGSDTRLTLVHDGWEARGATGAEMRDNYHSGWDHVLGQIPDMTAA